MEHLEQLYRQDGRQMPSMDLSDLPQTPEEARNAAENRDLQMKRRSGGAATTKSDRPNLLERIFSFGKSDRRQRPSKPRPGSHRHGLKRHAITGRQHSGHDHERNGHGPIHRDVRPLRLPGKDRQHGINSPADGTHHVVEQPPGSRGETVTKRAPMLSPRKQTANKTAPTADNRPETVSKPTPNTTNETTNESEAHDIAIIPAGEDGFPNPFPEMSEAEADSQQDPFTGLQLSDDQTEDAAPQSSQNEHAADAEDAEPSQESSNTEDKFERIALRMGTPGFKGFCPVALRDTRDLVESHHRFSSTFESKTYYFSTSEAKAKFDENPEKYAPVQGGNDVVQLAETGQAVEGLLEHAVWFQGRLYFFHSPETMQAFVAQPDKYARGELLDDEISTSDEDAGADAEAESEPSSSSQNEEPGMTLNLGGEE